MKSKKQVLWLTQAAIIAALYAVLPLPAALMPAVFNGIIIGLEIEIFFIEGPFHFASFLVQAGCVALGELVVCFALGLPLYKALDRPQVRGFLKS